VEGHEPVWKRETFSLTFSRYRRAVVTHLRQHCLFDLVQLGALIWAMVWWRHLPAPGYAIGMLALLAAVMSIHIAKDMSTWQQALWMLLIGVFLVIEFHAIAEDRTNFARDEAYKRKEENEQFQSIANGLTGAMQQSQQQFAATMSGIKKSIDTVTGGDTFCYVIASPVGNQFMLTVATQGDNPLHEISVELVDVDLMRAIIAGKPSLFPEDIHRFTAYYPTIPFLASTSARQLTSIPIGGGDKRDLQITFLSMNGVWSETLKLRLTNGQWAQALRVSKIKSGKQASKPLYDFVSETYPKTNGKVNWEN
jgi:hypothetical protein